MAAGVILFFRPMVFENGLDWFDSGERTRETREVGKKKVSILTYDNPIFA